MKLRAPAIPLFNVDPYFSVWMNRDSVNTGIPTHWTGSPNNIWGTVVVDGKEYRFLGRSLSTIGHDQGSIIRQTGIEIDACSTTVYFENSLKEKKEREKKIIDIYNNFINTHKNNLTKIEEIVN